MDLVLIQPVLNLWVENRNQDTLRLNRNGCIANENLE